MCSTVELAQWDAQMRTEKKLYTRLRLPVNLSKGGLHVEHD